MYMRRTSHFWAWRWQSLRSERTISPLFGFFRGWDVTGDLLPFSIKCIRSKNIKRITLKHLLIIRIKEKTFCNYFLIKRITSCLAFSILFVLLFEKKKESCVLALSMWQWYYSFSGALKRTKSVQHEKFIIVLLKMLIYSNSNNNSALFHS